MGLRASFPPTIRAALSRPPHTVPPATFARAPENFMTKRMLIDANHPEETRVVILDGSKVEEFDFEAASKRPLKGNIYLAKVTRVEPSLQAAFIDYGGNRHGFLAFAEIHPDYYQIPVADRLALLEEEARQHRDEEDDDNRQRRQSRRRRPDKRARPDESISEAAPEGDHHDGNAHDGDVIEGEGGELVPTVRGAGPYSS
jgi:ribonuclease E